MNRKEKLKKARLSPVIISQEFRNIYIKHKKENRLNNYYYCFYEGLDDSKYYNDKIRNFSEREVTHLSTDGKDNLIELYKILDKRKSIYLGSELLFFRDRDYDNFIKYDEIEKFRKIINLYITPTYSIENFYTTKIAFERIVKSEFNIIETDDKFEKLINLFLERQKEFHKIMLDINAWIATQSYFLYTKEKRNIPYNELNLSQLIKISLQKIKPKHQNIIGFLENKFSESFLIEDEEINSKFQELKTLFDKSNFQVIFRGKFEIDFLDKFLKLLVEKANQKDGKGLEFIGINEKIKIKLILNDTISNLTQYADTPDCLRGFFSINRAESDELV